MVPSFMYQFNYCTSPLSQANGRTIIEIKIAMHSVPLTVMIGIKRCMLIKEIGKILGNVLNF